MGKIAAAVYMRLFINGYKLPQKQFNSANKQQTIYYPREPKLTLYMNTNVAVS